MKFLIALVILVALVVLVLWIVRKIKGTKAHKASVANYQAQQASYARSKPVGYSNSGSSYPSRLPPVRPKITRTKPVVERKKYDDDVAPTVVDWDTSDYNSYESSFDYSDPTPSYTSDPTPSPNYEAPSTSYESPSAPSYDSSPSSYDSPSSSDY
jgi:type II secretory pathway pseudopilin PulG